MEIIEGQNDGYTEGEEVLVFHHKRGGYREREAKEYRDRATGQNQKKGGLFRSLVNTRGNRIMFFTMLFCFALVLVVSLLMENPDECTLKGVHCQLSAFSYEEKIYASVELEFNKKTTDRNTRKFHAVFLFYDADNHELYREGKDIEFADSQDTNNYIRCAYTDYDVAQVECVLTVDSEISDSIKCKVLKR